MSDLGDLARQLMTTGTEGPTLAILDVAEAIRENRTAFAVDGDTVAVAVRMPGGLVTVALSEDEWRAARESQHEISARLRAEYSRLIGDKRFPAASRALADAERLGALCHMLGARSDQ